MDETAVFPFTWYD